jgi:hypothetical protein
VTATQGLRRPAAPTRTPAHGLPRQAAAAPRRQPGPAAAHPARRLDHPRRAATASPIQDLTSAYPESGSYLATQINLPHPTQATTQNGDNSDERQRR